MAQIAQEKSLLGVGEVVYRKRDKEKGCILSINLRTRKNKSTVFYEVKWDDGITTYEPRSRIILNLPDRIHTNV